MATTRPIRRARFAGRRDVSPLLLRRLSDEQLGNRLASGEAAAFDELYRRYVHRLSAYGANLLGDAASGDDVAQSALLKAYGALRDGRVPDRVKPWLFRIAHNSAIDLVVRRRELPSAELPEGSTGSGEPVERSGELVAALASLPERQRRVYVLRELHGLRIDETAAELGLSSTQVEQSLFVARNRLAEQLVFGDRLNCVAVQRLVSGPLDRDERRALKTHLRSCPACRGTLGIRGRALELLPVASLDWLRGLFAGLATGGAPAAAKIGAVVVTATFAAGVSGAADQASHHPRPFVHHAAASVSRRHPPQSTIARLPAQPSVVSADRLVSRVTVVPASHPAQVENHRRGRGDDDVASRAPISEAHDGGDSGDDSAGGGDGQGGGGPQTTTVVQPQASDGGAGGSASGSGHSGSESGSGSGDSGSDGGPTATVPLSAPAAPTTGDSGGSGSVPIARPPPPRDDHDRRLRWLFGRSWRGRCPRRA